MIRKSKRWLSVGRYELLERRQLLASVAFDNGTVTVLGNATDDNIELVGSADFQSFTVRINSDPNLTQTFSYSDVTQLTVYGLEGNDRVTNTLAIGSTIFGGIGNDFIQGGYQDDILFGGKGNDTLVGRNGNDTLRGQEGNDWMYGDGGADRIFGFHGNDRIFGGVGDDFLQGDDGNDELHGFDGADQLLGGDGADQLFGQLGDDVLAGHNGNDLLIGGLGADRLEGNAGNDVLNGNEDNDTINAGPGDDTVNGGLGDDVILGVDGVNLLNGNGGDDRIRGGGGVDTISGGSGNDFLAGNHGDDVLLGGFGSDRLEGNAGNDVLNGNDGNDNINAGIGDDTVNGGTGDDVILGIDGTNTLNGNGGNDQINGGKAVDTISGGGGDDFLAGNDGQDVISGGVGADRLFGGSGDDSLSGEAGDDFLYGQQGNDILFGDQGNDRIQGNSGSDLLHYVANEMDLQVAQEGTNYRVVGVGSASSYGSDRLTDVEELAFEDGSNTVTRSIADAVSIPIEEADEIVARINEALPDDWRSTVRVVGNDIWLRTVRPNGSAHLDFRLGSAGVIAEVRDVGSGRNLLAPSFRGELTDRVIQWTLWEFGRTVRHDVRSLPDFEDRFNVTQAGTFDNVLNGTVDVEVDVEEGLVDVWSVVNHNWRSEQDPHMDGTITAMTRTQILDGGAILVRRIVRIGEIRLNGRSVALDKPYLEAWTPFSDSEFDSLALSIDASGSPDVSFQVGRDIPNYPHTPVQNTRGWAVSYDRQNTRGGNNLAVVFGTDIGTVKHADGSETTSHQFHLNSLDFEGGTAILPGLLPETLSEGAIIDQHFVLLPGTSINASTPVQLDALADRLPPPKIYQAGAELDGDLVAIGNRLSTLTSQPGVATDNIGRLV